MEKDNNALEELTNVLEELQFPCVLQEEEFQTIDQDKSGHIDFEEFHAYISHIAPQILEYVNELEVPERL